MNLAQYKDQCRDLGNPLRQSKFICNSGNFEGQVNWNRTDEWGVDWKRVAKLGIQTREMMPES